MRAGSIRRLPSAVRFNPDAGFAIINDAIDGGLADAEEKANLGTQFRSERSIRQ
jgi:hypothetical protein